MSKWGVSCQCGKVSFLIHTPPARVGTSPFPRALFSPGASGSSRAGTVPCLLCLGVLLTRESEPLRTPHAFSGLHHHPTHPRLARQLCGGRFPAHRSGPTSATAPTACCTKAGSCVETFGFSFPWVQLSEWRWGRVRDLGPHLVLRDHFCLVLQMTQGGYLRPCPGLPAPELESWRTLPAP